MPRRELNEEEQALYEDITFKLNRYMPDKKCIECIDLLDDLIDSLLKEETNEAI